MRVRPFLQTLFSLGGWDHSETVACWVSWRLAHEHNTSCPLHRSPPHHSPTGMGLVCPTIDPSTPPKLTFRVGLRSFHGMT